MPNESDRADVVTVRLGRDAIAVSPLAENHGTAQSVSRLVLGCGDRGDWSNGVAPCGHMPYGANHSINLILKITRTPTSALPYIQECLSAWDGIQQGRPKRRFASC
jgi:hypothetical protein